MKKMESLASFKANQMSETHASQVLGGEPVATGAGTMQSPRCGTTGFGWKSDKVDGDTTYYYDTYDFDWG